MAPAASGDHEAGLYCRGEGCLGWTKNLANQRAHGISFEEAGKLFTPGSDYLEIFDEAHSNLEDRFIAIGPIDRGIILVAWTAREDDTFRIISARWATKREQALYHSYMDERR